MTTHLFLHANNVGYTANVSAKKNKNIFHDNHVLIFNDSGINDPANENIVTEWNETRKESVSVLEPTYCISIWEGYSDSDVEEEEDKREKPDDGDPCDSKKKTQYEASSSFVLRCARQQGQLQHNKFA